VSEAFEPGGDMAVTRDVDATRERVWDVLADGWTYSSWVVGNSRTRAVSRRWPSPGTRILHSIGAWPTVINDENSRRILFPARGTGFVRPGSAGNGGARITLRLSGTAAGCRVAMSEVAVSGPLSWLPGTVQRRHSRRGIVNAFGGWRKLPSAETPTSCQRRRLNSATLIVLQRRSATTGRMPGLGCNQPHPRGEAAHVDAALCIDGGADKCSGEGDVVQAHSPLHNRSGAIGHCASSLNL
jgi:hypothetical protein